MPKSAKAAHRNISNSNPNWPNDTHELKKKKKNLISTKNESKYSSLSLAVSFLLCAILRTGDITSTTFSVYHQSYWRWLKSSPSSIRLNESRNVKKKIAHVKLSIQCWFFYAIFSQFSYARRPLSMWWWDEQKKYPHTTQTNIE